MVHVMRGQNRKVNEYKQTKTNNNNNRILIHIESYENIYIYLTKLEN